MAPHVVNCSQASVSYNLGMALAVMPEVVNCSQASVSYNSISGNLLIFHVKASVQVKEV